MESLGVKNVFSFQFGSVEDKQRILKGASWTFKRQLLSLIKPTGIGAEQDEFWYGVVLDPYS